MKNLSVKARILEIIGLRGIYINHFDGSPPEGRTFYLFLSAILAPVNTSVFDEFYTVDELERENIFSLSLGGCLFGMDSLSCFSPM